MSLSTIPGGGDSFNPTKCSARTAFVRYLHMNANIYTRYGKSQATCLCIGPGMIDPTEGKQVQFPQLTELIACGLKVVDVVDVNRDVIQSLQSLKKREVRRHLGFNTYVFTHFLKDNSVKDPKIKWIFQHLKKTISKWGKSPLSKPQAIGNVVHWDASKEDPPEKIKKRRYDVIVATHSLFRYGTKLEEAFRRVFDLLKPGGTLYLDEVSFQGGSTSVYNGCKQKFGQAKQAFEKKQNATLTVQIIEKATQIVTLALIKEIPRYNGLPMGINPDRLLAIRLGPRKGMMAVDSQNIIAITRS